MADLRSRCPCGAAFKIVNSRRTCSICLRPVGECQCHPTMEEIMVSEIKDSVELAAWMMNTRGVSRVNTKYGVVEIAREATEEKTPAIIPDDKSIIREVAARSDNRCQVYLPKEYTGKKVKITILG